MKHGRKLETYEGLLRKNVIKGGKMLDMKKGRKTRLVDRSMFLLQSSTDRTVLYPPAAIIILPVVAFMVFSSI